MNANDDLPNDDASLVLTYPRIIDPDEVRLLEGRQSKYTADRAKECDFPTYRTEMDAVHSTISERLSSIGYKLSAYTEFEADITMERPNYPPFYELDFQIQSRRAVNRKTIDVLIPVILLAPHRYTIMVGVEILDSFELFMIMLTREGAFGSFENAGTAKKMGFDPTSGRLNPPWVDRGGPPWVDPGEPLG